MRIVLYEWCCSGGLHTTGIEKSLRDVQGSSSAIVGGHAQRIATEGRAVLESLAHDATRDASLDITVLLDERWDPVGRVLSLPACVRVRKVLVGTEIETLCAEAVQADWTLIVAPETAGILLSRVAAVRHAGGRVAAPSEKFIALATDKQATVLALAAAGVPVPAGCVLDATEPLPAGFYLPAVRKARASVGCDGLSIARSALPTSTAKQDSQRVEAFIEGVAVGVSCLCGPESVVLLPPVLQRFSTEDAFDYLGGKLPIAEQLRSRAEDLARRAIAGLAVCAQAGVAKPMRQAPVVSGWVGVDMILGRRDDGSGDRVLEVNPRLTTSFVGLRHLLSKSLVRAILDRADGQVSMLRMVDRADQSIEFDKDGAVRFDNATTE